LQGAHRTPAAQGLMLQTGQTEDLDTTQNFE